MFVYAMMYQIIFIKEKKTDDSYRAEQKMTKLISLPPSKNGIHPFLKRHDGQTFFTPQLKKCPSPINGYPHQISSPILAIPYVCH